MMAGVARPMFNSILRSWQTESNLEPSCALGNSRARGRRPSISCGRYDLHLSTSAISHRTTRYWTDGVLALLVPFFLNLNGAMWLTNLYTIMKEPFILEIIPTIYLALISIRIGTIASFGGSFSAPYLPLYFYSRRLENRLNRLLLWFISLY